MIKMCSHPMTKENAKRLRKILENNGYKTLIEEVDTGKYIVRGIKSTVKKH